jgi:hypothetical protein
MKDLPVGLAQQIEREVKATLKLAGFQPVRGHEYFPASALPVILDIADHYPITVPAVLAGSESSEVEEAA